MSSTKKCLILSGTGEELINFSRLLQSNSYHIKVVNSYQTHQLLCNEKIDHKNCSTGNEYSEAVKKDVLDGDTIVVSTNWDGLSPTKQHIALIDFLR